MIRLAAVCAAICAVAMAVACGGGSTPSAPSPPQTPAPPAAPAAVTVSGTVTATNGGHPLGSVSVEAAGVSGTTDGSGRYSLSLPAGTQGGAFAISGSGLLTRNGFFAASGSRSLDLDAFALDRFDAAYFRAIARNGHEDPGNLQPLRRWTRAPMLYIRTIDDTGRPILPEVLQQVASIASSVVPQYTNGRFGLAAIEQGTETRRGQAGWITVEWTRDAPDICGSAHVGLEGGGILLTYDKPNCSCG